MLGSGAIAGGSADKGDARNDGTEERPMEGWAAGMVVDYLSAFERKIFGQPSKEALCLLAQFVHLGAKCAFWSARSREKVEITFIKERQNFIGNNFEYA